MLIGRSIRLLSRSHDQSSPPLGLLVSHHEYPRHCVASPSLLPSSLHSTGEIALASTLWGRFAEV
eukprot:764044-Hanusia_phi.AAC.5